MTDVEMPVMVPSAAERVYDLLRGGVIDCRVRAAAIVATAYRDGWEARGKAQNPAHGHNKTCIICGKPCNALVGNPSLWPVRLDNEGWRHTGCANKLLAARQWRPIETAPKDGSTVLLFFEALAYPIMRSSFWAARHQCWYGVGPGWEPTHWQPLPEPPEEPT